MASCKGGLIFSIITQKEEADIREELQYSDNLSSGKKQRATGLNYTKNIYLVESLSREEGIESGLRLCAFYDVSGECYKVAHPSHCTKINNISQIGL